MDSQAGTSDVLLCTATAVCARTVPVQHHNGLNKRHTLVLLFSKCRTLLALVLSCRHPIRRHVIVSLFLTAAVLSVLIQILEGLFFAFVFVFCLKKLPADVMYRIEQSKLR